MPGNAIGTVLIVASAHVAQCLLLALGGRSDALIFCLLLF